AVGQLQGSQQSYVSDVWLATTEPPLHSPVTAGENAGHALYHAPVLRWLHKTGTSNLNAAPPFAGESDLKLDSAWKRNNLRIVAFVQEKRSHHILGAAVGRFEP